METDNKGKHKWKWLLASGGTAMTVFTWELLEEFLENVIAYGISVITSTILLIFATQGIKLMVKKLAKVLFPLIKQITYKEGNDKVKVIKNYWQKVWNNKITGTLAGLGFAGISYFQTVLSFATNNWWFALIVFVVFYNIGIFFGGETLKQIQSRLADATLNKEQKAKLKAIENKAHELAKLQFEDLKVKAEEILEKEKAEKESAENENKETATK